MKLPEQLGRQSIVGVGERVYGQPYQTPDGATVVTVSRVRNGLFGRTESPVGVCVIRGDDATFVSAVDANRVPTIAISTALLSAAFVTLAILRRPPWPDLRLTHLDER
ncbi:hypothetical protein KIH27_19700 [Mycobacterium sp. M1]|uniref:Uncharacterized protein n=1 Tax=Mycolicibacter acidiphilus TaxID=2835306 RepID=A0ABS5RNQ2_9MYCO|nr:hypothetical protein [Mycolicibacter acidiphilus]MBS9535814.1 hypothetical protein [Mycolicibacter acidiphilus]